MEQKRSIRPAAKIALIVVAVVALFLIYQFWLKPAGYIDALMPEGTEYAETGDEYFVTDDLQQSNKQVAKKSGKIPTLKVGVVTWGGYAGGQYFNGGFEASKKSRYYTEYGILVEFIVLDDFAASRSAFKTGSVDLLWCTVDALPTEMETGYGLSETDPQFIFQADWSRGGDVTLGIRGISSMQDLRGKTIAVAEMTPSHSFLIWSLNASGMTTDDVNIVPVASAIDAANMFKSGNVDAAVVWSPDDISSLEKVKGSTILASTKMATHIIADGFIVTAKTMKRYDRELGYLVEGWLIGSAEINSSPAAKNSAIKILEEGLGIKSKYADLAINNVRLATLGDNLDFFDLSSDYTGVVAEVLYTDMAQKYQQLGYVNNPLPWHKISNPKYVKRAQKTLNGYKHDSEAKKKFVVKASDAKKEAFATKRLSITFPTGSSTLDNNAKYILDEQFVPVAKRFSAAKIRIEGNTDNTGSLAINLKISKQRAEAVKSYLSYEHNMDPNRFIVVGNGPNAPIADNGTEAGRALNRRTDFELVK